MRRSVVVLLLVGCLVSVAGGAVPAVAEPRPVSPRAAIVPPPRDADWDYQLGGVRSPAARVDVVVRDRTAAPARGRYNVCYVNGFQTQASERRFWRSSPARWALVLKRHGRPVVDSGWGEWLLDTRTPDRRARLARIVGRWVAGCAADGFDAVELDNLDSWSRSHGLISRSDNRRLARLLAARAHRHGLAVAQKNWAELGPAGPRLGFDFAIVEECGRYRECAAYVRAYRGRVLAVEYTRASFAWTCRHFGSRIPVVRRDRDLTRRGMRRWC